MLHLKTASNQRNSAKTYFHLKGVVLSGYAVMRMHVEMIAGQRVSARVVTAGGAPARRPPASLPV